MLGTIIPEDGHIMFAANHRLVAYIPPNVVA